MTIKLNNNNNSTPCNIKSSKSSSLACSSLKKPFINNNLNIINLFESKSLNNLKPTTDYSKIITRPTTTNKFILSNNNIIINQQQSKQVFNKKMKIIPSPTIRIADLFRCFLKNVPKNTETIEVSKIFSF